MSMTTSAELETLDAWFGSTVLGPATWDVALYTTAPGDDGTGGTEVSGNGYSRIAVTNNATNFPAATDEGGVGTKKNGEAITSDTSSGAWGTIAALGFFDGATLKHVLTIDPGDRQTIDGANQQVSWPADSITITAD